MVVASRGLTLAEFLALPERKPALEYAAGVVTQKVSPRPSHGTLQFELGRLLWQRLQPRRRGGKARARVFTELRTTFAGRSYVPDVAIYRRERVPLEAAGLIGGECFEPPDLAIEIFSPGQRMRELERKCAWYVANGVPLALLLDHRDETIRVFRPGAAPLRARAEDRITLDEVAPGLCLTPAEVFAPRRMD